LVANGRPRRFQYPPAVAKVAHPAPTLEWDTPLYEQPSTLEARGVYP
jgi:hypothetical protein